MVLLLVDDHPLFSVGFAHALRHAEPPMTVLTATTVDEALALAQHTPELDMVLVDYRLAGDDGLAGLRRFGERFPLVARMLISGDEDASLVRRAREAGASAFLGKSLTLPQVQAVLAQVAAGGQVFPAASSDASTAPGAGPTARQMKVLSLVARGKPNKVIAHELGIAERTVKLHITALLDILAARNRTHLLVRAREVGLI